MFEKKKFSSKYRMRVIRGAFLHPEKLDILDAKIVERVSDKNWQSIEEVSVDFDQIRELQEDMIRHNNDQVPWYMDGRSVDNEDECIVAFGVDDGEDGKVFLFSKDDIGVIDPVIRYGMEKGAPREQMDFIGVDHG